MTVPQKLIDEMIAARNALEDAQGLDGQAANSAAAATAAAELAGKDRDAALEGHQKANELAQTALADIAKYLEGQDENFPTMTRETESSSTPATQERPEKIAGATMRKAK